MTNRQLIKRWKNLSIRFNTTPLTRPLTEMFAVCWGEHEVEVNGKKEKVIVFDEGSDPKQGAPAVFCQTDKKDIFWVLAWDSKKNTYVRANVGRFVKKEEEKE